MDNPFFQELASLCRKYGVRQYTVKSFEYTHYHDYEVVLSVPKLQEPFAIKPRRRNPDAIQ